MSLTPSPGMRSTNGSRAAGAAARTASITLSNACGPVIAETFGKASRIAPGSAPMQPVTITLPFSFIAWPMAASDSAFGAVEKAAGVDDDRVRPGVAARKLVAFGAQAGEDAFAVDERLRAAERNEGNARRGAVPCVLVLRSSAPIGMGGRAPASERFARRGADRFFGDPINVTLAPDRVLDH